MTSHEPPSETSPANSLTLRYTPLDRVLKPLVPTLYAVFLAATIVIMHSQRASPTLFYPLLVIVSLLSIYTWWRAWTFRIHADNDGLAVSGGLTRKYVQWREVEELEARRETYFRGDENDSNEVKTLLAITLANSDALLLHLGQDLRSLAPADRERLLDYITARVDIKPQDSSARASG